MAMNPTDLRPPFTLETARTKVRAAEEACINDAPIEEADRRIEVVGGNFSAPPPLGANRATTKSAPFAYRDT